MGNSPIRLFQDNGFPMPWASNGYASLEKAREAWERAAALDPANSEVHTILNFLENPPKEESK